MLDTSNIPPLNSLLSSDRDKLVDEYASRAIFRFKSIAKAHVAFHVFFGVLLGIETLFFGVFFSFWSQSFLLACPLAALVLTIFVYIILISTFQSKKTEQFWRLKRSFLDACSHFSKHLGKSEHHLSQASVSIKLATLLQNQEFQIYHLGKSPLITKLSCLLHWKDTLKMKEILFLSAIDHYVQLVPIKPTDIELHTLLAKAFVSLSNLYYEPPFRQKKGKILLNLKGSFALQLAEKFKQASNSAIQEFKILESFSPNDPWIHSELAICYRHLHMPAKEIEEYEKIMKLCPEDADSAYRLGILYFQEGQNAKALKIYEYLKRHNHPQTKELLKFYNVALRKLLANSSKLPL